MKALLHINKYFWKYRLRLSLGALFVIVGTFFSVFSVPWVGKAIDYVYKAIKTNTPYNEAVHQLLIYASLILGATLLNGLFMFLKRQTIIVMSRLVENDLKNEIYQHYQTLDLAFYKRNNTGDLMNRISEDVSRVRMYVGPAVMYIIDTVAMFVLTIVFMVRVNPELTLYTLLPLPFLAITIYYVSDRINKKSTEVQEKLSDLSTQSQESFSGIRVLKAFGLENMYAKRYLNESNKYREKQLELAKIDSLFNPLMIFLIGLSTLITIYVGGKKAIDGTITTGNIAEFVIYVSRLTWPITSLGWVVSLVQRAAASQKRINEFLNTKPTIKNEFKIKQPISGAIEFKNVSFTYPDTGIKALTNVSFIIEPGKTIGIIGRTGSGKSTIASLLSRLYDVDSGQILMDGIDIRNYDVHYLRNQLGYVPQEVFLFSESISENIAFSANGTQAKPSQTAIEEAARNAAIYSNIQELSNKFETIVGERGITLSGGQKQRISIARAIIKDPTIFIFDDCLSAVDTETEEEILKNIERIKRNKTTIIISHRISSVKTADYLIVLDDGQIQEQGTHVSLIEKQGAYYNLYQKQLVKVVK